MFGLLRYRSFCQLFIGQMCSDFANWLDFLALSTLIVFHWNLGAEAMAALFITLGIPWVVIGPVASVWTRSLPPKPFMIACDMIRMGILVGLIWAPNLWSLLSLVFCKGAFSAIFDPIRQSYIRVLVYEKDLPAASALSQLSTQLMKILAPVMGGLILTWSSPWATFGVGAFLYGLSGLVLSGLPALRLPVTESEVKTSFLHECKQGWSYIRHNRILFQSVGLMAVVTFLIFLYDALFVLLADQLGVGQEGLAWFMGSVGLGSVLGSLMMGNWTHWKVSPLSSMVKSTYFAGIMIGVIGMAGIGWFNFPFVIWLLLFASIGCNGARSLVPFGYLLQVQTPVQLTGRVSATTQALQNVALLTAPSLGAMASQWLGVGGVFLTVGCMMVLISILFQHKLKKSAKHTCEK